MIRRQSSSVKRERESDETVLVFLMKNVNKKVIFFQLGEREEGKHQEADIDGLISEESTVDN